MFKHLRTGLAALAVCGALAASGAPGMMAQAQLRRSGANLLRRAQQVTGDRFRFETVTPAGTRVYAVNRPSGQALDAIDRGLSQLFAVARRRGYKQHLNFADYTVFIGRADRQRDSAGAYSPDIAVGAAQYAGSVYDRGGYVYAAGMVLSMAPGAFLIAEHDRDFGRIANVARYEGEHIILYNNDRRLFQQTYDHSRGGGHPILR